MGGLVVKPRSRIFHGHEWVYGSEVKKVFGDPAPGDVISLKDFKDRPLGSAIYNPQSQIVARRFSRRKQDLDEDFFVRRLRRAWSHREEIGQGSGGGPVRCAWSESDGLPGVVLDRYGDQFALQTLTLGMDQRRDAIVRAVEQVFEPSVLVLRNDGAMRGAEGLESEVAVLRGSPRRERIDAGGIPLLVDVLEGQKTGLYLDQLENARRVAAFAPGTRVLDCFCNQGAFALHAARAGAAEVTGVDTSETAVSTGEENAREGGLPVEFHEANVFDFLKKAEGEGHRYGLIILDPPSFTRSKKSVAGALRGYKEIHLRALKMLEPGGILATFSCSHHIDRDSFLTMIRGAAVDARRSLRRVESLGQRRDHPVLTLLPETEYLAGETLEVIPAW